MKEGECVHFKQPFRPNTASSITYQFGLVAAVVTDESRKAITDILVELYDPDSDAVYRDERGNKVLYSFLLDEIEPS